MKQGFKLAFITLPLVAIGAGVLAFVVSNKAPPERLALAERATAVRIIQAEHVEITPQISGFGIASPARTYEAIAEVGGTAEYVNPLLAKGEILPAGAVLLRVSQTDFNLAVAQANANIRSAEARLAELEISIQNQTAALAIENEALALKLEDLERADRLFTGGTISQSTRDAARAAHLAQRQKVLSVESSLALMPTQRAVQTEQISVYQANLETAKLNLSRTELTLPFAARVASVTVETGQYVRPGQTAALLDGIDAAEVEARVSVTDLRKLFRSGRDLPEGLGVEPSQMTEAIHMLGLSAAVHLRTGDDIITWPATLDRISDTIEQKTGTLGVIVRVNTAYTSAEPGNRPPLTKGMFVEVSLGAEPMRGIVVPRSALRAGQLIIANSDSRLELLDAHPALVQGDIALFTDGIAPGTTVVVSAPSPVVPGMLLELTEDTALMVRLAAPSSDE